MLVHLSVMEPQGLQLNPMEPQGMHRLLYTSDASTDLTPHGIDTYSSLI